MSTGKGAADSNGDGYPGIEYGLVLSGGGAKGACEAGVIDALAAGTPGQYSRMRAPDERRELP